MSAAIDFGWMQGEPEMELRALLEHSPIAFAQLFGPGRFRPLNPAMERLLTEAANAGQSGALAELIDPQNQEKAERLLDDLFSGECNSFQLDSTGNIRSGKRWMVWRVGTPAGNSDYALAMAADIAIDREHLLRLRQAEKLESVGRLAGGIAHDFNNLLTGVLLYCDLLMASIEPGHRERKYAEEIRNAGLQASALVRQLLALAKPANSARCALSLNEAVQGTLNLLERLIGENVDLTVRLDPNLGIVTMEPTEAQQILLNMVLNARDAMPGGGRIEIETGNCELQVLAENHLGKYSGAPLPCVLFVVADNGGGMDALTRTRLFEDFFTTKPADKGTGLGLATVRDIVSRNGGLIYVKSALGLGTRISVILPRAPHSATDKQPENSLDPEQG